MRARREALLGTARRAEDAGYSTFLIRDHFIEEPFGHQLAPLAALAAVAGATNGLRVGSLVLSNDYRHPVDARQGDRDARRAVERARRARARRGFSKAEYDSAGIPFDPPGIRVDRLEEAIHVLKGLFGEGPLTFAGKHYVVTNLDGFPKPVQRPRPPLLIGAAGKRMLSIAAREADIIGFQTVSTANGMMADDPSGRLAPAVAQRVEQVRQVAGERFREIELSMVATVVFTEQRRQAAERLARDRGWKDIASEQVLEMPSVFIGSLEHIVDEMRARRERYGFSYYVVLDDAMEKVAPIVARLAGT